MAHASKFIVGALVAAASYAQAQSSSFLTRPWELLGGAMQNQRKVTCKCLILCRDPMNSDSLMDVWSEQYDGKLKLTVLSPLSSQGITSIDNGHEWLTYRPDENRLMIESSPREEETERNEASRIRLAERNYTLSFAPQCTVVAGKKCYELHAVAKHSEMPERVYDVDKSKDFLLRMEIVGRDDRKVMLDTKEIEYPRSISDEDFELAPHGEAKVVTYAAPVTLAINKDTKQVLGFRPAVPQSLPFGFVVEAPQVVDGKSGKFMAVRITDGLVNATVYEWPDTKKGAKARNVSEDDRSANGVKLRVKGELPREVQGGLLDCFIREALKRVESCLIRSRTSETLNLNEALNCPEETNREDEAHTGTADVYSNLYAIVMIDVEE